MPLMAGMPRHTGMSSHQTEFHNPMYPNEGDPSARLERLREGVTNPLPEDVNPTELLHQLRGTPQIDAPPAAEEYFQDDTPMLEERGMIEYEEEESLEEERPRNLHRIIEERENGGSRGRTNKSMARP